VNRRTSWAGIRRDVRAGLLYPGDCKMAAPETRAEIAANRDSYLTRLLMTGAAPAQFPEWVEAAVRRIVPHGLPNAVASISCPVPKMRPVCLSSRRRAAKHLTAPSLARPPPDRFSRILKSAP
jgi:hypothetical protein